MACFGELHHACMYTPQQGTNNMLGCMHACMHGGGGGGGGGGVATLMYRLYVTVRSTRQVYLPEFLAHSLTFRWMSVRSDELNNLQMAQKYT